jgi:hypothetical protein
MAYLFQSGSAEYQLSGGVDFQYSNVETDKLMAINSDAADRAAAAGVFGLGADGSADGALYWDGSALCVAASTAKVAHFDGDGLDLVTGDAYLINNTSVLNATTLGTNVVNSSLTSLGAQAEALDMGDYAIQNVGDIDCDSVSVADAAVGLDVVFGGNNTLNKMTLTDNLADALNINEGGTMYMKFVTTNGSEEIAFGKDVNIDGGAIDGTVIGGNSVAAGSFAAVVGTTATFSSTLTANGDTDLGDATSDTITATGRFDSDLVPSTDSARDLGTSALQWADIHADAGYIDAITVTGTSTLTTVDINGGNIDGTAIGAASADAGTFTTLDCTDGAFAVMNLDIDGATDVGEALVDADLFIVDNGADGTNRKSTLARLKTYIGAGNEAVEIHGVGANVTLVGGMNVATGSFAADRTWTLPRCSSISEGEIYRVKVTALGGNTLTVAVNANDSIDDLAVDVDLQLESDNGSISLMCIDTDSAGKWKIF